LSFAGVLEALLNFRFSEKINWQAEVGRICHSDMTESQVQNQFYVLILDKPE